MVALVGMYAVLPPLDDGCTLFDYRQMGASAFAQQDMRARLTVAGGRTGAALTFAVGQDFSPQLTGIS